MSAKSVGLAEATAIVGGQDALLEMLRRGDVSAKAESSRLLVEELIADGAIWRSTKIKDQASHDTVIEPRFWIALREAKGKIGWEQGNAAYVTGDGGATRRVQTWETVTGAHLERQALVLIAAANGNDPTSLESAPTAPRRQPGSRLNVKREAAARAFAELYPDGDPGKTVVGTRKLHEALLKHHLDQGRDKDHQWSPDTTERACGRKR